MSEQTIESSLLSRDARQREALERINDEFDCWLYVELTACPVQLYGYTEYGHWLDFYARGEWWWLCIGHPKRPTFKRQQKLEAVNSASWLDPDAMETILRECLTAYKDKKNHE